jgi:hypothetical protein
MTMMVVTLCFSYFVSLCIRMYSYYDDKYQSDTLSNDFGPDSNNFYIDNFNFLPSFGIMQNSYDSEDILGEVTEFTLDDQIVPNVEKLSRYFTV